MTAHAALVRLARLVQLTAVCATPAAMVCVQTLRPAHLAQATVVCATTAETAGVQHSSRAPHVQKTVEAALLTLSTPVHKGAASVAITAALVWLKGLQTALQHASAHAMRF